MENQAVNPYLPGYEYVPDGEPHVFGERVYIYGSHDAFNGRAFCVKNYVCWSAPIDNLADFRYEGVIYEKEKDKYTKDAKSRRLFAPDVQKGIDGRYYLYYAFDFTGVIGVAVCDTPAGSYEYYGHIRHGDGMILGEKMEDTFHYDPGVLVDKDGKVYLYSGFCPKADIKSRFSLPRETAQGAMVMELEKDMLTIKKEPVIIIPDSKNAVGTDFFGHSFFEAASIRKVLDKYYFIYSSEHGHELCYAVSDKPHKDFTYGGILISNGDIGYQGREEPLNYTGTNHGSIEKIGRQWYVFYHRQTNGNPYSRQGCGEKITILEDGSIPQVEMTSCGLHHKPLRGTGTYSAGIACCLMSQEGAKQYQVNTQISKEHPYITQEGEDRESGSGQYITNMREGAFAGYKYFDLRNTTEITVKVRGGGKGILFVQADRNASPAAEIRIEPTKDFYLYTSKLSIQEEQSALWFTYRGSDFIELESFTLA